MTTDPVDPTGADLKRYLQEDQGGPVVMLNLLRFRPDGGRERYQEYVEALRRAGSYSAEPLYFGSGGRALEAEECQEWDAVALVRYPSRQAFAEMIRSPEYRSIKHLRSEALSEAVLQPTVSLLG